VATLLARLEGILGPLPRWMLHRGRYAHKYFLRDGRIFEKNSHTVGGWLVAGWLTGWLVWSLRGW
jgi:hypothetical protein